jgi:hypothetical protein
MAMQDLIKMKRKFIEIFDRKQSRRSNNMSPSLVGSQIPDNANINAYLLKSRMRDSNRHTLSPFVFLLVREIVALRIDPKSHVHIASGVVHFVTEIGSSGHDTQDLNIRQDSARLTMAYLRDDRHLAEWLTIQQKVVRIRRNLLSLLQLKYSHRSKWSVTLRSQQ